jgi:acetyl esterase/lipase
MIFPMKMIFSILLVCSIAVSCKKSDNNAPSADTEVITQDVAYGNDPAQKMDIYLPAGRTSANTKVMVLIHGGGWTGGDKSEFAPYIPTLRQRLPGYALFNINYRLASQSANHFPTQENDVKAAVEFIAGKLGEYSVSKDMVLLGFSAGAHLALLQGYKHAGGTMNTKAIVSFFGPTDMADMYNNPTSQYAPMLLQVLLGTTPQQNLSTYQQSSPLFFAKAGVAPTIMLHGGLDDLVRPAQATMLRDKLQSAGVANQFVFYPNEGHGWFGPSLDDSFNKIEAFLSVHVK